MPLDIQVGDIAERLRRFLDLRGRIPARLDEIVVPTISLGDLARPPYSRDPLSGWHLGAFGAVAGEISMVGLLPQGADKLVIKKLVIVNDTAGAITYEVYVGSTISASPTLRGIAAVNLPRAGSGLRPMCTTNGWDDADPALPAGAQRIGAFRVGANSSLCVEYGDWVISTDDVCWVSPNAVNTICQAVWNFDEYNKPIP